jgi:putative FmdB family regulatory protein
VPIYEYEPDNRHCFMCDQRVEVMQGANEEPLQFCPHCGLEVKRIISQASFSMRSGVDVDKAGERGFTTWKKSGKGVWERVAGEGGPEIIEKPEG